MLARLWCSQRRRERFDGRPGLPRGSGRHGALFTSDYTPRLAWRCAGDGSPLPAAVLTGPYRLAPLSAPASTTNGPINVPLVVLESSGNCTSCSSGSRELPRRFESQAAGEPGALSVRLAKLHRPLLPVPLAPVRPAMGSHYSCHMQPACWCCSNAVACRNCRITRRPNFAHFQLWRSSAAVLTSDTRHDGRGGSRREAGDTRVA